MIMQIFWGIISWVHTLLQCRVESGQRCWQDWKWVYKNISFENSYNQW